MKRDHDSNPDAWEKDPLWELLRQSPSAEPRPTFVDDVVRAARLESNGLPWWKRFALPLTFGGLTTAATAAVAIFIIMQQPDIEAPATEIVVAEAPTLEALDEVLRTEALLVAADYPADFSDAELVALIAY